MLFLSLHLNRTWLADSVRISKNYALDPGSSLYAISSIDDSYKKKDL